MPFHVRDPWRLQYFEQVPCPAHVNIAIDDIDCWEWFPDYRYIYDKLNVARSQGVACGTSSQLPETFPVFAKPRVNLHGMGLGSRVIHNREEFSTHMSSDMMWMELFSGDHVSTDCAVVKGEVKWLRHATGFPWTSAMFRHWIIHATQNIELNDFLVDWVARELPHYTGMINIETIGGKIIEAQIRFADQWCDLNGTDWLDAVVGLYQHGVWNFDDSGRRDGFSVPLFAAHGKMPRHPSHEIQNRIRAMPDVASLQITFHEAKGSEDHFMPPGGFRLGIVNCWNLQSGLDARAELAKAFPDVEVMIPA